MTTPGESEGPFRILIVCTANICRSPMAEHLLRMALDQDSRIEVTSAGIRGFDNAPMDPPAAAQLRRLGGDPTGFRSRPLTDQMCELADLILTATRVHRSAVLERVPRALRRTFTLPEFAAAMSTIRREQPDATDLADMVRRAAFARGRIAVENYDVADPYGGPVETHRAVAEMIRAAAQTIAQHLLPPDTPSSAITQIE
ncbi:MAG: low molecular weight phosphatase family protein [Nakamurella sp.]